MFNKVIIIGNLTRDVDLRFLPSGTSDSGSAVATIGLASNRRYKKRDGTQGDEVCFVDVKLFGRTAEIANQYLKKGSQILIEGRLTLESWVDASGTKKNKHTIIAESMQMLGKAQAESYGTDTIQDNMQSQIASPKVSNEIPSTDVDNDIYKTEEIEQSSSNSIDINDDEIPF